MSRDYDGPSDAMQTATRVFRGHRTPMQHATHCSVTTFSAAARFIILVGGVIAGFVRPHGIRIPYTLQHTNAPVSHHSPRCCMRRSWSTWLHNETSRHRLRLTYRTLQATQTCPMRLQPSISWARPLNTTAAVQMLLPCCSFNLMYFKVTSLQCIPCTQYLLS
jgi:hypothetical protein